MAGKKRYTAQIKRRAVTDPVSHMDLTALVSAIKQAHGLCAAQASHAVNVNLTVRNWLIGWYLREYEQCGADRAGYGETLIDTLAERLESEGMHDMSARTLRQCRQFYTVYAGIWQTPLADSLHALLPAPIWQTLSAKSGQAGITNTVERVPGDPKVSAHRGAGASPMNLFTSLTFSHFAELITIDDPLRRAFYEIECIRGAWSVRTLKRQIATLHFERSGLSSDREKLTTVTGAGSETSDPRLAIRDPYIFEFLGLKAKDAVVESDLESALVANLRDFLLELGHGFCLEAQQKSIVIGTTRGFVDLVFYHRILKCHVLVELKMDEFRHEHIGQLNTYVTWYRRHMMAEGDNPPVGLLLCTQRDSALVDYALAAIDNRLFVSKYLVELPAREDLQRFLERKRRELGKDV